MKIFLAKAFPQDRFETEINKILIAADLQMVGMLLELNEPDIPEKDWTITELCEEDGGPRCIPIWL